MKIARTKFAKLYYHPVSIRNMHNYTYVYVYTGCPLKKVGAMVGAWRKSTKTKKSYIILPISQ